MLTMTAVSSSIETCDLPPHGIGIDTNTTTVTTAFLLLAVTISLCESDLLALIYARSHFV